MRRSTQLMAGLAAAALATSAVQAHPKLNASVPAANSATATTNRVQLQFSEKLVPQFSKADVVMTAMPGMKMTKPMAMTNAQTSVAGDGQTLVITFAKPLPRGTYLVSYQVVSADTHRIEGKYNFQIR